MFVLSVLLRVNVNICVFIAFNSILEIDDGIGSLAFFIVFSKFCLDGVIGEEAFKAAIWWLLA